MLAPVDGGRKTRPAPAIPVAPTSKPQPNNSPNVHPVQPSAASAIAQHGADHPTSVHTPKSTATYVSPPSVKVVAKPPTLDKFWGTLGLGKPATQKTAYYKGQKPIWPGLYVNPSIQAHGNNAQSLAKLGHVALADAESAAPALVGTTVGGLVTAYTLNPEAGSPRVGRLPGERASSSQNTLTTSARRKLSVPPGLIQHCRSVRTHWWSCLMKQEQLRRPHTRHGPDEQFGQPLRHPSCSYADVEGIPQWRRWL